MGVGFFYNHYCISSAATFGLKYSATKWSNIPHASRGHKCFGNIKSRFMTRVESSLNVDD